MPRSDSGRAAARGGLNDVPKTLFRDDRSHHPGQALDSVPRRAPLLSRGRDKSRISSYPLSRGMTFCMGFEAEIGSNVVPAKAGTQSAFESLACRA